MTLRQSCRRVACLLALWLGGAHAWAQEAAAARAAWWLSPRLSLQGTASDNLRTPSGTTQADGSLTVTPGFRLVANGQNVKGFVDYGLSALYRARSDAGESIQHNLNSQLTTELVDERVFLDLTGNIARRTVSALGQQVVSSLQTQNQTQTTTGSFSPYARLKLPLDINLQARYSATGVMTQTRNIADTLTQTVSLGATQALYGRTSWGLDLLASRIYYNGPQPEIEASSANVRVNQELVEHLRAYVQGGVERNNYASLNQSARGQSGFGIDWRPDTNTRIALGRTKRFFGEGHDISVEQRWRRSSLRFTDSRTLSAAAVNTASASLGTLNDLLDAAFRDIEPDPVARAQLVSAFLQNRGLSGDMVVRQSFLTSSASVQRQQSLTWASNWARDTLALSFRQSWTDRLQGRVTQPDDDLSVVSQLKTVGWNIVWGHRLTPRDSLNVSLSQQRVTGSGQVRVANGSESFSVGLNSAFSRQLTGSLAFQRNRSRSQQLPYTENAVVGTLLIRF